jgi:actin-related protein
VHQLAKYGGRRFDVHIGGRKMLALLAATEDEATRWVATICQLSSVKAVGAVDAAASDADVGDVDDDGAAQLMLLVEGRLKKKSPTGIPGMRPWQERYFALDARSATIRYFHTQADAAAFIHRGRIASAGSTTSAASSSSTMSTAVSSKVTALGVIPLGHARLDKKGVTEKSKKNFRFDIDVNRRTYELEASSFQEWEAWTSGVERVMRMLEAISNTKGRDWIDDDDDVGGGTALRDDAPEPYCPIIIDNGACSFKAGFGGESLPLLDVPSVLAKQDKKSAASVTLRKHTKKYGPISSRMNERHFGGSVQPIDYIIGNEAIKAYIGMDDITIQASSMQVNAQTWGASLPTPSQWEDLERSWAHLFDHLHIRSFEQHPVMMTIPVLCSTPVKKQMKEILFETFGIPAAYITPSAALPIYSYGRTTALVVDIGHSFTQVMPVCGGFPIEQAVVRQLPAGGRFLTDYIAKTLCDGNAVARAMPPYQLSALCADIKEKHAFVATDVDAFIKFKAEKSSIAHSLPDGLGIVHLGGIRGDVGEVLFSPQRFGGFDESMKSLPELVVQALKKCPLDERLALMGSVVLCGGGSQLPGVRERLLAGLQELLPEGVTDDISVYADPQRKYSAWTGGSILSGLDAFQSCWQLKYEYEELGATAPERLAKVGTGRQPSVGGSHLYNDLSAFAGVGGDSSDESDSD